MGTARGVHDVRDTGGAGGPEAFAPLVDNAPATASGASAVGTAADCATDAPLADDAFAHGTPVGDASSDTAPDSTDADSTDADTTDAGVEDAMFDLGGDERRMHVRAYNYWVSLLKRRPYPSIEDLDPDTITDFGPHSVLLDFSDGVTDPKVAYLGRALREECGLVGPVRSIADVPSRSLLSRLTDHYLQIIANRAPIGFEAEFVGNRGHTTLYRGILMPFSSSGDGIDFIYGVINWKELVDATTQATLDAELDAAVRAAPQAPLPAPLPTAPQTTPQAASDAPVWADGPSAGFAADEPLLLAEPISADSSEHPLWPEAASSHSMPADPALTGPLGEQLAMARESAAKVRAADARNRATLYRALGRAHDFACAAKTDPDAFAAILSDACIVPQDRAPMASIVKLVFGTDYDKARQAEFAAVLCHAHRHDVAAGGLPSVIDGHAGGIKAIVAAERLARRPSSAAMPLDQRPVLAHLAIDSGAETGSTVLLVARVGADGVLEIVASIADDDALNEIVMRTID